MTPVTPHLTSEILNNLNSEKIQWPKLKKEYLIKEEKIIVIQINGKKEILLQSKMILMRKS